MTTTRALLLDLDNTLLDRQAAVRAYLHAWATVSGAVDVEGFVNKALHIDRSGYTSREAFLGWWAENSVFGPPPQKRFAPEDLWSHWQAHLHEHIAADPLLKPTIEALQERFVVLIVTNGGSRTQRPKLEQLGLTELFKPENILVSGELGVWKPDAELFRLAAKRAGCHPRECLFVGDDPVRDIEGAAAVGMQTCWVRMERDTDEVFGERACSPDHIIDHYTGLLELP